MVVENAGDFDIVLGDGDFAIVKDFDKGEQSWNQWELDMGSLVSFGVLKRLNVDKARNIPESET